MYIGVNERGRRRSQVMGHSLNKDDKASVGKDQ